ncbi:MAG: hypothetical protein KGQ88_02505 [Chloroflexi bacterium]|nr:hypothetical protein [Chloroflexota bacterium]
MEIFNPVAESTLKRLTPAPRRGDLGGKRVGLYWNMKIGGDVALERVSEDLSHAVSGASFTSYRGSVGHMMRHMTAKDADKIASECDVVVASTGD